MRWLLLGQLAIPLGLVAWMTLLPARGAFGVSAQTLGSLLVLGALAKVGIWLFPPWWVPYAAGVLVVAAALGLRRRRSAPFGRLPKWTGPLLWVGAGLAAAVVLRDALLARRLPADVVAVELAFPLPAGRYLVANGGGALLVNAHRESMDTAVARLRPWRGNGHAVDLIAIDAAGVRARGLTPPDPTAYAIFGRPVLAPCAGRVVAAVDGHPDMRVPEYDRVHPAGNHVILACAGVHVVLAHLRAGSVRVRVDEAVAAEGVLGAVGNSGGTNEPHLHIHAQRPGPEGEPMAGDPIPMLLAGRYLVRGDRVTIR